MNRLQIPSQGHASRARLVVKFAGALTLVLTSLQLQTVLAGMKELTPAAAAAIRALYPGSEIEKVGREREGKLQFFEVSIRASQKRIEVEVASDGSIGEIEQRLELADLPAAVAASLSSLTSGGVVRSIEKIERRGTPGVDTFVPLASPSLVYEIEYRSAGTRHEARLDENGRQLKAEEEEEEEDDDDGEDDENEEPSIS